MDAEPDMETRIRRAMASYKQAAMYCKAQGDERAFKAYRVSWCTLEALCPVDPKEYW
jgi:hypothetical protein